MINNKYWLKINTFYENNRKLLFKIGNWLFLFVLAVTFFIGAASYNHYTQKDNFIKWSSPDETANYHFAKLFGQEKKLSIFEKNNLLVSDVMHPRSFRSDLGEMKPVSFPGILLIYGGIVSLTSYEILPYITPAFAAIGLIFYYLLINRLFGRRNALMSTLLLACFPVYIYFSAHSMFHNILFIVFLIIGFYYAVLAGQEKSEKTNFLTYNWRMIGWKKIIYPALAGLFFGLAIITRTSELLWLGPVLFLIWLINIKNLGFTKLIIILAFIGAGMLPAFYWNQILYGSPINTGYPEMNQSLVNIASAGTGLVKSAIISEPSYIQGLFDKLKDNIFHFGFHPRESLRTFFYYFPVMFYWIFWPAAIGAILFLQGWRRWSAKEYAYLVSSAVFSVILILYYGSWDFHDNPNPTSFTIGNSYTRYWLPIYLAAIPLASLFILRFSRAIYPYAPEAKNLTKLNLDNSWRSKLIYHGRIRKNLFCAAICTIFISYTIIVSLNFALLEPEEGLVAQSVKQTSAKADFDQVMSLTEPNSVIITRYHDKLFFPERKVIVGLFDDQEMNRQYAKLEEILPIYYYNFSLGQKDIDYLNNGRLKEIGLQIKKVKMINESFTLYKLVKYIPPPPTATSILPIVL